MSAFDITGFYPTAFDNKLQENKIDLLDGINIIKDQFGWKNFFELILLSMHAKFEEMFLRVIVLFLWCMATAGYE